MHINGLFGMSEIGEREIEKREVGEKDQISFVWLKRD
jgi:hypothetical protein